jgi:hypothetical protein
VHSAWDTSTLCRSRSTCTSLAEFIRLTLPCGGSILKTDWLSARISLLILPPHLVGVTGSPPGDRCERTIVALPCIMLTAILPTVL